MSQRVRIQAEFIPSEHGRVFVLARRPQRIVSGAVLIVPPFAEEMNKCRRMVTECVLKLAAAGVPSIILDLFGTGDSDGEFKDATWARWRADVQAAMDWAEKSSMSVTKILGIRLGCALAVQTLRRSPAAVRHLVLWQPVWDGKRFVEQFLRLRVAAKMMEDDQRETIAELRAKLAKGEIIEVAGYELTNELVSEIESASVDDLLNIRPITTHWMEVVRAAGTPPPLPATKTLERARAKGFDARLHCVSSEPFWTSTEIVTCPELADASVAALDEAA